MPQLCGCCKRSNKHCTQCVRSYYPLPQRQPFFRHRSLRHRMTPKYAQKGIIKLRTPPLFMNIFYLPNQFFLTGWVTSHKYLGTQSQLFQSTYLKYGFSMSVKSWNASLCFSSSFTGKASFRLFASVSTT